MNNQTNVIASAIAVFLGVAAAISNPASLVTATPPDNISQDENRSSRNILSRPSSIWDSQDTVTDEDVSEDVIEDKSDEVVVEDEAVKQPKEVAEDSSDFTSQALDNIEAMFRDITLATTRDEADKKDEKPVGDAWEPFDQDSENIRALAARVRKLEESQLTEQDVIEIVQRNFTCLRISQRSGSPAEAVTVASDVPDVSVTVPGFAGTFQVPKGGIVTSVRVIQDGKWVDQPINRSTRRTVASNGVVMHTVQAGPYRVLATNYQQPTDMYRVSVYDDAQLTQEMASPVYSQMSPVVGSASTRTTVRTTNTPTRSPQRRGFFNRLFNPPIVRRGSTCRLNSDGTMTCN